MVNSTSLFPRPNISTFVDFLEYGNYVSNNLYMNLGVGAFFIVSFITLMGYTEPKKAFATSSFITMILSFLFHTVGVLSEYLVAVFVIMTALSAFYLSKD